MDARDADLFPSTLRAPAFRLLWAVVTVLALLLAVIALAYLGSVS